MIYFFLALYCTENVRVRSGTEPEPPFGFMFGGFAEPNPEHYVRFGFEHCSVRVRTLFAMFGTGPWPVYLTLNCREYHH